ncbi:MAG: hypothetical protein KI785_03010 [Devosiaceae bacterium]|nr:hypothetical protein [Devosiaceae bacterium MH13]
MFVDTVDGSRQAAEPNTYVADDLGEAFTLLPRFIRSQNGLPPFAQGSAPVRASSIHDVALLLADYVADYLGTFHGEPFVATRYEPAYGRLNANRMWDEAHFQMHWEPLRGRGRRTVYDLNVGAHDLAFIASELPADRRDAVALCERLDSKQDKLIDLAWENSVRFLDGVDFEAWKRWSLSLGALVPFVPRETPGRFSVCLEAGPVTLPVEARRVSYHVADAVRRTSNLLSLL